MAKRENMGPVTKERNAEIDSALSEALKGLKSPDQRKAKTFTIDAKWRDNLKTALRSISQQDPGNSTESLSFDSNGFVTRGPLTMRYVQKGNKLEVSMEWAGVQQAPEVQAPAPKQVPKPAAAEKPPEKAPVRVSEAKPAETTKGEGPKYTASFTPTNRTIGPSEQMMQEHNWWLKRWMEKHGFTEAFVRINGTGAETKTAGAGSYDAVFEFTGPDKRLVAGMRGSNQRTTQEIYGQSYEFAALEWGNRKAGGQRRVEVWLKDVMADLVETDQKDGIARIASVRGALLKENLDIFGYASPETGTFSFAHIRRGQKDSAALQIFGGPSVVSAAYQKMQDRKFSEYSGSLQVFQSLGGAYQTVNSIGNFVDSKPVLKTFQKGDLTVIMNELKMREKYTGGTLLLGKDQNGNEVRLALSPPFMEKQPDSEAAEIFVKAYVIRMVNKGGKTTEEYVQQTVIPIFTEGNLSVPELKLNTAIEIRPSHDALDDIRAEFKAQNYNVHINNIPLSINPTMNPTQVFHSMMDNSDYQITVRDITLQDTIIDSKPRVYAEIMATKVDGAGRALSVPVLQKIELGRETSFLVSGGTLRMKIEFPPNLLITMNTENITQRIEVRNSAVRSEGSKVDDYVLQNVNFSQTGVNLPGYLNNSTVSVGALFLSDKFAGLRKSAEKEQEGTQKGTTKEREISQERLSDVNAMGTTANFAYQNALGLSMNAVNGKGQGLWVVGYNGIPTMKSGINSGGTTLYQMTARTPDIGSFRAGMTGGTVFDTGSYTREAGDINLLRRETGAALDHYTRVPLFYVGTRTGGASVEERRTVGGTKVMATGSMLSNLSRALDVNRPGLQTLSLDYKTESLAGREGRSAVEVRRSNFGYTLGYSYENLARNVFKHLYGRMGIERSNELYTQESALFSNAPTGMTLKEAGETTTRSWNPRFGFTGSMGAYEAGYKGLNQDQASRSAGTTTSSMTGRLRQDSLDLITRGIPILTGEKTLEVDGLFSGTWSKQNNTTIDTLSRYYFMNASNMKYEIQPTLTTYTTMKIDDKLVRIPTKWYTRIGTEMYRSEQEDIAGSVRQRRTTEARNKAYVDVGRKGPILELWGTWSMNDQRTATELLNGFDSTYNRYTSVGLNALGHLGKTAEFNLHADWAADNQGNKIWRVNGGFTVRYATTFAEPEPAPKTRAPGKR